MKSEQSWPAFDLEACELCASVNQNQAAGCTARSVLIDIAVSARRMEVLTFSIKIELDGQNPNFEKACPCKSGLLLASQMVMCACALQQKAMWAWTNRLSKSMYCITSRACTVPGQLRITSYVLESSNAVRQACIRLLGYSNTCSVQKCICEYTPSNPRAYVR